MNGFQGMCAKLLPELRETAKEKQNMKYIITFIATALLMGCASEPNYSGSYLLTIKEMTIRLELKPDGSFVGSPQGDSDEVVGTWKVEGELLVCEGTTTAHSNQITIKFNKETFKLDSIKENGRDFPAPLDTIIPEGWDGIYLQKKSELPSPQSTPSEEAKLKPSTAKAPDISIFDAAKTGNIEAVKQHLAEGADVNAKGKNSWTPLHWAAGVGHTEVVVLLIAKGANVNAKDDNGETPLNWAIFNDETEIAVLLRKHGGKTREELKTDAWGPMPTKDEVANWPILETKTYKKELSPKSLKGQTRVFLLLQNNLNLDIDMIWLDFDGKPQSYGIIKAGESRIIPTFSTHRWLLKDKLTEEIIGFYVTQENPARIKMDSKTGEELKAEGK